MASRYVEAVIALLDEIIVATFLIYIFLYFLERENMITAEHIMIITVVYAGIIGYVTYRVAQLQASRAKIGPEALIGLTGEVLEDLDPQGKVLIEGEIWTAVSARGDTIKRGEKVRVINRKGLTLYVERIGR